MRFEERFASYHGAEWNGTPRARRRSSRRNQWPPRKPTRLVRGDAATPAITVMRVGVVIGVDFLPDREVTVRITRPGESVSDYVTYTSDRNGDLHAELPATALSGYCRSPPPTIAPTRMASAAGSGVTPEP